MTTKAGRQPPKCADEEQHQRRGHAAPIEDPLSKSATAQPRSRRGNHSETAFVAAGQFAASPAPSRKRKPQKLRRPRGERREHGHGRVPEHGDGEAVARAEAVEHAARHRLHHRVGDAERDDDEREVLVRPVNSVFRRRAEDAQRLAVEVVDDGREEEQPADPPAVAPRRRPPRALMARRREGLGLREGRLRAGAAEAERAEARRRRRPAAGTRRAARPAASRWRKPALKESPAPVVSTVCDRDRRARWTTAPPSSVIAPFAPRAWPRRACGRSRARRRPSAGSSRAGERRELDLVREEEVGLARASSRRPAVPAARAGRSRCRATW